MSLFLNTVLELMRQGFCVIFEVEGEIRPKARGRRTVRIVGLKKPYFCLLYDHLMSYLMLPKI